VEGVLRYLLRLLEARTLVNNCKIRLSEEVLRMSDRINLLDCHCGCELKGLVVVGVFK
jgi:hypothetical protein